MDRARAVGSFAPNPFGVFDMQGNVWEWVNDCYSVTLGASSADDAACRTRVIRGGGWGDYSESLRSANRDRVQLEGALSFISFRIARSL